MTDTVQIYPGLFVPGYVDVFFQVGYLTDSSCPEFPQAQSGDTIAYPTEIQFIEIPVGYSAGLEDHVTESIDVYPNPVENDLYLDLKVNGPLTAYIYSMDGQLVKTINANKNILDVSDLSSGQYILSLSDEQNNYRSKFLKN